MADGSQVWIAGGVGITPFLSLARDLGDRSANLIWSVRTQGEAVLHDELTQLAEDNPRFSYSVWPSNERGHLGADDVLGGAPDSARDVLICGPGAVRDSIEKGLRAKGVPSGRIHSEEFAFR